MSNYKILTFPGTELPKQYEALVYSKWLRSLRHGNDFFKLVVPAGYYEAYPQVIKRILDNASCQVRLAVLEDDADICLGFLVYRRAIDHDILDYIHVQKDMRKQGVAAFLLPHHIKTITHLTKTALIIWNHPKYKHLVFNPFV